MLLGRQRGGILPKKSIFSMTHAMNPILGLPYIRILEWKDGQYMKKGLDWDIVLIAFNERNV